VWHPISVGCDGWACQTRACEKQSEGRHQCIGIVVGALVGALLGLISNPRLLVLLMAVFAGSTAGAVAGRLRWGDIGEIGGQVAGGLVGGIAWAVWLFVGGGRAVIFDRERMQPLVAYFQDCPILDGSGSGNDVSSDGLR